jgi:hypothetical protein
VHSECTCSRGGAQVEPTSLSTRVGGSAWVGFQMEETKSLRHDAESAQAQGATPPATVPPSQWGLAGTMGLARGST